MFRIILMTAGSLLVVVALIYLANLTSTFLVSKRETFLLKEESTSPNDSALKKVESNFLDLIKHANLSVGEKVFRQCVACHSLREDARHKIGPNLWGIVGRNKGHAVGYKYSTAFSQLGGKWSFRSLNDFLEDPRSYAPGNKMSFKGIKNIEKRAALIAYLNTQSNDPMPLPIPLP